MTASCRVPIPGRVQAAGDSLPAENMGAVPHEWGRRRLHPFTAKDRPGVYRYRNPFSHAEFSLTEVGERPASGRVLFDECRTRLLSGRAVHSPHAGCINSTRGGFGAGRGAENLSVLRQAGF